MWCANKPAKWLDGLSERGRAEKQIEARDSVKGIKRKMKERRQQILATRTRRMDERYKKKLEAQRKLSEKKLKFMVKLEKLGGLWKSVEEMKICLRNIEEEKIKLRLYISNCRFTALYLLRVHQHNFIFESPTLRKGEKLTLLQIRCKAIWRK